MSRYLGVMMLGLLVTSCGGCSSIEQYREGRELKPEQIYLVRKGMPKSELLTFLGNPADTVFLEPTSEDTARQVRVREVMTFRFSTTRKTTKPPILGNAVTETGTMQQLEVGLENGIVTYDNYTEGTP